MQILGVNGIGLEGTNDLASSGRDLPWLQDTIAADVWNVWPIAYRDVVILDRQNVFYDVYNLTTYNLADAANRDELKQLLRDAGTR